MNKIDAPALPKKEGLKIYLVSSTLVTIFLFYIDEGYYSFKWMADLGAWVVFVIYVVGFFAGQILMNRLVPKTHSESKRRLLTLILGIPLGLFCLFILFSNSTGRFD